MMMVIDSNVLFSALIRDSTTRKIIFEYDGTFLFPSYIFEEMERHKEELIEKSGMTYDDFECLLQLLLKKVRIVEHAILDIYKEKATHIVKDIDLDDAVFIACALAYPGSVIWSNDKKLKSQNEVRIFNTMELLEFLEVKS